MSLCCPWILKRCPHFTDVWAQDGSVSSIERWEEKILQIKTPSVYSWDPVFRIWSSWGSSLGWSVTMGEEATAHPEVKQDLCKRQDTQLLHHLIPSAHGPIKEQSHYPSPPFFFFFPGGGNFFQERDEIICSEIFTVTGVWAHVI